MARTKRGAGATFAAAALGLGAIGFGCGEYDAAEAGDAVERVQSELVEGFRISSDPSFPNELQSETSSAVQSTTGFVYTAFNADDPTHITYPTTLTRKICRGAAGVGYSIRNSIGGWSNTMTRFAVPTGYSAIWSDPAMGQAGGSMFFGVISSPTDRFNVASQNQECWTNNAATPSASGMLVGACFYKSTSQSLTPNFAPTCVRTGNDFYDGGSMSGDPFGGTSIMAAYYNYSQSRVDVYLGPNWTRIASPFPGKPIGGHALAVGGYTVVAPDKNANLWISNFNTATQAWSTPVPVGGFASGTTTLSDGTTIRSRGYTAAFIGQTFLGGPYGFYVAYAKASGGFNQIHVSQCLYDGLGFNANIFACNDVPAAATPATSNAFMPAIAVSRPGDSGSNFLDIQPRLSYWSDQGLTGGKVALRSFNLNTPTLQSVTAAQHPCPDGRDYWGDYDDMVVANDYTPNPTFIRPYTDSSDVGCSSQEYIANPQRVSVMTMSINDFAPLSLQNGWTNGPFSTSAAAVTINDRIVTMKGAIATSGTNAVPFVLPSAYRPSANVYVPVDTCAVNKGRLFIQTNGTVTLQTEGPFANARCFVSLEGVSFAKNATSFTALALQNGWTNAPFSTRNAAIKNDGGIARLQGAIATTGTNANPFVLPSGFRPATNVYVPVDLCSAAKGRLFIQPDGTVTVQTEGAFSTAQCFTSLEGVTFALSAGSPMAMSLGNSWTNAPFGTRNVAAVDDRRIVRFWGAMQTSGTNMVPFTMPTGMRPPANVYVPVNLCNSTKGRIQIKTNGEVSVHAEKTLSDAQCFTSLEGVAFAL